MSIWYEIKKQEDIEVSDDGRTIEVLFKSDNLGNHYVDIPISLVANVIMERCCGNEFEIAKGIR